MKNAEAKKSLYSIRQQYWARRLLAAIAAIDGVWVRAMEKKIKRKYKGRREWPDAAEPQQMARHILQDISCKSGRGRISNDRDGNGRTGQSAGYPRQGS